jgi:hypothetical protein
MLYSEVYYQDARNMPGQANLFLEMYLYLSISTYNGTKYVYYNSVSEPLYFVQYFFLWDRYFIYTPLYQKFFSQDESLDSQLE